ncbi:hypothetical protein ACWXVL_00655 [Mycoplasma sp. 128]|uniref:hypothetical protein n=1 Tax=Mycoplasma sp. 3341 TaxID=3447506 RepID=UPI003F65BE8A
MVFKPEEIQEVIDQNSTKKSTILLSLLIFKGFGIPSLYLGKKINALVWFLLGLLATALIITGAVIINTTDIAKDSKGNITNSKVFIGWILAIGFSILYFAISIISAGWDLVLILLGRLKDVNDKKIVLEKEKKELANFLEMAKKAQEENNEQ